MPKNRQPTAAAARATPGPLPPFAAALLAWYDENKRALPFRQDPTPYHVWVSEAMLQQTQVATALPYYERFIARLPTVAHLAACGEDELHKLWEGLGYYSRARNLQKAARVVMQQHGGQLPASYAALLALPGVGPYTAGAIASIAFGLPEVAVDGNVLRVASRLLASDGDITRPEVKRALSEEVRRQQPAARPGDFNQALMELGALICLPANPRCAACPLAALCRAKALGIQHTLPVKAPPKAKRSVDVTVLVVHSGARVLLQQRPPRGLLAGLWQPLTFEEKLSETEAAARLAALVPGAQLAGALPAGRHIFTHRVWQMTGWLCTAPQGVAAPAGPFRFVPAEEVLQKWPLPGAFKAYLPHITAAAPQRPTKKSRL
ncbi:MAG: A/G-specific adenine glycosylase [Oscillospiraceae bacterium]